MDGGCALEEKLQEKQDRQVKGLRMDVAVGKL